MTDSESTNSQASTVDAPTPSTPNAESDWTPFKIGAAVVLTIVVGVLGGVLTHVLLQRRHQPPAPTKVMNNPANNYGKVVTLHAQTRTIEPIVLGKPMLVKFSILNLTGKPVPVADRSSSVNGRRDEYSVIVEDENGQRLKDPFQVNFNPETKMESDPVNMIDLPHKMFKSWTIDISKFAIIEKPGKYKLTISRHPFVDKVRVAADPIQIEVLSPTVRPSTNGDK